MAVDPGTRGCLSVSQSCCYTSPVLKYFSPQAQTEGQGDASQNGIGFVLMQEGQPVTNASRALTPAEQRYSQIEKELLAQVELEHNNHDTFGRRVILWTDHKLWYQFTRSPSFQHQSVYSDYCLNSSSVMLT